MKQYFRSLSALAAIGVLAAIAIVGFGLYNVSARQGHFLGVSWVFHTTFKQSVRLRAPDATEIPTDFDAKDRIELGALHFKTACAFCHATPGEQRSATALAMNPRPPHITEAVSHWQPEEMFWIVREGVKMSGMPHWPTEARDDEIWSVVAYLDTLRDIEGTAQSAVASDGPASCAQCHGEDGASHNSFIPRLDILTAEQLADALTQYRKGTRASGFMAEAARNLTDAEIKELADKFAAPPEFAEMPGEWDPDAHGAKLALRGTDDVPACAACHGPGRVAAEAIAPSIIGQSRDYLTTQLILWQSGRRQGTGERTDLMSKAARNLTGKEIEALSDWYASLAPRTVRDQSAVEDNQ